MSKKLVGKAKAKARKKNIVKFVTHKKGMSDRELINAMNMMNSIYNAAPNMIHEKDFVPMDCVLCGAEMKTVHDTGNPYPLTEKCYAKEALEEGNPNRCCSKCNREKVLPARLGMVSGINEEAA